jgi:tRNA(Ile)-lysidine synthase
VALAGGWEFAAGGEPEGSVPPQVHNDQGDAFRAFLDAETLPTTLELRAGRPGDRFSPLGLHGHSQKLSDFFVNEKVPRRLRQRWPLLCSGKTLLWVPGFRVAEDFKISAATRRVIRLRISAPEPTPD